jgi:hypothetical protein
MSSCSAKAVRNGFSKAARPAQARLVLAECDEFVDQ